MMLAYSGHRHGAQALSGSPRRNGKVTGGGVFWRKKECNSEELTCTYAAQRCSQLTEGERVVGGGVSSACSDNDMDVVDKTNRREPATEAHFQEHG